MVTSPTVPARRLAPNGPRLTARPGSFWEPVLNSAVVWLALMVFWALADLLITIFPPSGRSVEPEGWLALIICALVGLVAIWCMHRAGFPAAWDARIPASRRLLLPTLVGVGGGLLAVGLELIGGASKIIEAKLGTAFNVVFPGSLLVYSAGAIKFEFIFLLVPVPVLLWLISNVMLRGRGQAVIFWGLAVLSSALEPAAQGRSVLAIAQGAIRPESPHCTWLKASPTTSRRPCCFAAMVCWPLS